jgi:hypothetical protein
MYRISEYQDNPILPELGGELARKALGKTC